jgi:glycosyltransferase involved in cell wall biosynthesis
MKAAAVDPRIRILHHRVNMGVGMAVMTGYRHALDNGADIIVKLDGDGQMAPEDIGILIDPIVRGEADYVKGNRFFDLEALRGMPWVRLVGNAGLSFLSKVSSGYWNLFDPTNGFTAIHARAAERLPWSKLSPRYFFESDMLFRLNTLRAVVTDVPLVARYGDEESNLKISNALLQFPFFHARNLAKRVFYNYFLRDFNAASVNLVLGLVMVVFGTVFGTYRWVQGAALDIVATPGTVMVAALPVILGFQSLLSFIQFDVSNTPHRPLQKTQPGRKRQGEEAATLAPELLSTAEISRTATS